jgi:3-hydroxyisobutyrate dehydrogenase
MSDTQVVTIVGAGALGAAMAARLGETGHEVRLWNRTPERARAAAGPSDHVTAVESFSEAVAGASVVVTVLRDGDAVTSVMTDGIGHLDEGAVWVQASTIGPESAGALAELAARHGVAFLDAPVSGSTTPARQGKLVWLVAGDKDVLGRAEGVLNDLGSSVMLVGSGVEGSSLKLVVNAWMATATVAMSDSLGLCDGLGISHEMFAEALKAGPLAMPYALVKLQLMDDRAFEPGFAVQLALKDVDLADQAVGLTPLFRTVRERLQATVTVGHGDQDLAAVDVTREPG